MWLSMIFYILAATFARISLGMLLLRMSGEGINKNMKRIIYSTLTISTLLSVFYFFFAIFQCWPVSYYWNQFNKPAEGSCVSPEAFPLLTVITDVAFFLVDVRHDLLFPSPNWPMVLVDIRSNITPCYALEVTIENINYRCHCSIVFLDDFVGSIGSTFQAKLIEFVRASLASMSKIPFLTVPVQLSSNTSKLHTIADLSLLEPALAIVALSLIVSRKFIWSNCKYIWSIFSNAGQDRGLPFHDFYEDRTYTCQSNLSTCRSNTVILHGSEELQILRDALSGTTTAGETGPRDITITTTTTITINDGEISRLPPIAPTRSLSSSSRKLNFTAMLNF